MTANATNGLLLAADQWLNHPQADPQRLLLLNLMPTKLETERQFLEQFDRLNTDVELTFIYPTTHHFKGLDRSLIADHYATIATLPREQYDGLIITGAPVETLPFEHVDYYDELLTVLRWAESHVTSNLFECWAAQFALYSQFGIQKCRLPQKLFGIYTSRVGRQLLRVPQSRRTGLVIDSQQLPGDLTIDVDHQEAGPVILTSQTFHSTYITGHPEYAPTTLLQEYWRDRHRQQPIQPPVHYFSHNGRQAIDYSWATSSQTIYQQWLTTTTKKAGQLL